MIVYQFLAGAMRGLVFFHFFPCASVVGKRRACLGSMAGPRRVGPVKRSHPND